MWKTSWILIVMIDPLFWRAIFTLFKVCAVPVRVCSTCEGVQYKWGTPVALVRKIYFIWHSFNPKRAGLFADWYGPVDREGRCCPLPPVVYVWTVQLIWNVDSIWQRLFHLTKKLKRTAKNLLNADISIFKHLFHENGPSTRNAINSVPERFCCFLFT